jgi:hypothetical protein
MPERLPNQITTVSAQEMFTALGCAWLEGLSERPTGEQLCLLVAQSAFETGWWKYMHNFNIGNVKSVEGDGRDFTYFRCWELFDASQEFAFKANKTFGHLVEKDEGYGVDAKNRVKIWFGPDHPACRFRAYKTLELGCVDHLNKLIGRFSDSIPERDAWGAVKNADPVAFAHALKLKGYYTGDEATYTRQVKDIFTMLLKKEFDMEQIPYFTEKQREEFSNWRQIGILQHLNTTSSGEEEGEA